MTQFSSRPRFRRKEWESDRAYRFVDLPKRNPTNPILVEFRAVWGGQPDIEDGAEHWLTEELDGDWERSWTHEATGDQIDHARRVLARLIAFTKESA